MNKFKRPGNLTLPAFLLIASFTFTLFSCGGDHDHGRPPYNVDSVKSHVIPLSVAIEYTKGFQRNIDTLNTKCPGFKDSMRFGYSEAFNHDSYELLLAQNDSLGRPAAGIRIYYGRGPGGQTKLILVPYDVNGNDILHKLIMEDTARSGEAKTRALTTSGAEALEQGQLCPPNCPPAPSPLQP